MYGMAGTKGHLYNNMKYIFMVQDGRKRKGVGKGERRRERKNTANSPTPPEMRLAEEAVSVNWDSRYLGAKDTVPDSTMIELQIAAVMNTQLRVITTCLRWYGNDFSLVIKSASSFKPYLPLYFCAISSSLSFFTRWLSGKSRGKSRNGMARNHDTTAEKMKHSHHAPTHPGSSGWRSVSSQGSTYTLRNAPPKP